MCKSIKKEGYLNILGGTLLFICALVLIGASIFFFIHKPVKPNVTEINITIKTDTTGVIDYSSYQMIDSLASVIKRQNIDVRDRYLYLIEQKENENKLITYLGVIVSLILAIFGFFGYKSFKSIEDKAVSNAEDVMKNNVNDKLSLIEKELGDKIKNRIDEKFTAEIQTTLPNEVSNQLNEKYNENISSKINFIKQKEEEIKNIKIRLDKIDNLKAQLRDMGIITEEEIDSLPDTDLKKLAKDREDKKNQRIEKGEEK